MAAAVARTVDAVGTGTTAGGHADVERAWRARVAGNGHDARAGEVLDVAPRHAAVVARRQARGRAGDEVLRVRRIGEERHAEVAVGEDAGALAPSLPGE